MKRVRVWMCVNTYVSEAAVPAAHTGRRSQASAEWMCA